MLYQYSLIFLAGLLCVLWVSSLTEAQQPTVTINSFNGEVLVFFQGRTPTSGIIGTVLRAGDAIQTYNGANVRLTLSDGSRLTLGENTNITISALAEDLQTGARMPRLELVWGRLRSILSPLYQTPGSSFTVQTPNALIGVTSSELDAEVMYEPMTKTTTVLAYEFDVRVTNLLTGVSLLIPQGHSGVIHGNVIQEIARIITLSSRTAAQQQTATITSLSGEVFVSLQGEDLMPGIDGMVLRAGDTIRTENGATVALELSDESVVKLGGNTTINIYALAKDPQTSVRTSRLDLFRGSLRSTLTTEYQAAGSSFTVRTPDVLIAMRSVEPDTEVIYDPNTSTTIVLAHKSDVMLTYLLTEISATIPEGHSGIIRDRHIQEVARILRYPAGTSQSPTEATQPSTGETAQPSDDKTAGQ